MLIKETARDWWLVVLVGVLVIGANLPEEYTTRFSIDKRVLLAVLVAMVVVSLGALPAYGAGGGDEFAGYWRQHSQ